MARYSLNQIEHAVRKAARGSGLSWGVAEDAGRAVRWLQMVGLDGPALAVSTFEQLDHSAEDFQRVRQRSAATGQQQPDDRSTWLSSHSGLLSPLVVGPCIGDWANAIEMVAEANETRLNLENVIQPLLLAGYCGAAAQQTRMTISLQWPGFMIRCGADRCRFDGGSMPSRQEAVVSVVIGDEFAENPCATAVSREARIGATEVDGVTWDKLAVLSHRTYVEATESSRLAGAGAGLNDND